MRLRVKVQSKPWRMAAALSVAAIACARAQDDWAVPEAVLRIDVEVTADPTEPEAGVLAIVPDGGLLPRPVPVAVVMDTDGRELKSECVWHNPTEGYGLVFEPPKNKKARIYFKIGSRLASTTAGESRFKPGVFLYIQKGRAELDRARRMAADWPPVGRDVRMGAVHAIGHRENPFGADDDYSSYYVGWIKPAAAGRYYVATVSDEGSEARIDGKTVANWPGLHDRRDGATGKFGSFVDLSPGFHKVEYFHFEQTGAQEANLCWKQGGGPDPKKPPLTIPRSAYVHSGDARMTAARARGGAPVAVIDWEPVSYFWFVEKPVVLYRFKALGAERMPAGFNWIWEPEAGLSLATNEFHWVLDRPDEREVTLKTGPGPGASRSTVPIYYGRTPRAAKVGRKEDLQDYRDALLARCRAVPAAQRPCAGWSPEFWSLLMTIVEPYSGRDLLTQIFERSRRDLLERPAADRWLLEDYFFEILRYTDKKKTSEWLDRFESEERDTDRKFAWKVRRVDFTLHDLSQPDVARRLAEPLVREAVGPRSLAMALVSLGDVERDAGETEAARKHYGLAQDQYQKIAKKEAAPVAMPLPSRAPPTATAAAQALAMWDWRSQAVRAGAYYETIRSLLAQRELWGARQALQDWELEFPLTKINGDFPLAEAEFYKAIGNNSRVVRILSAYRKGTEMSNRLPEAMKMEMTALMELNRVPELEALAEQVLKTFPNLPVAELARRYSREAGRDARPAPRGMKLE